SAGLETLHPGPDFHLPRPRAARLVDEVEISRCDGVGIEQACRLIRWLLAARALDAAVDDHMRDMDALGMQFARHALREPAHGDLAHRKRRRLRIALYPGGGAGEQDRAAALRQHPARRLLGYQERAIGSHRERPLHISR